MCEMHSQNREKQRKTKKNGENKTFTPFFFLVEMRRIELLSMPYTIMFFLSFTTFVRQNGQHAKRVLPLSVVDHLTSASIRSRPLSRAIVSKIALWIKPLTDSRFCACCYHACAFINVYARSPPTITQKRARFAWYCEYYCVILREICKKLLTIAENVLKWS